MKTSEHILISGGTGFIGQHLIPVLLQQGHQVTVWGRDLAKILAEFGDTVTAVSDLANIKRPVNTIINLAGANIGTSRWSDANKQRFIASRVQTTQALLAWAEQQTAPPQRLINGSAIGYYGIDISKQWQQVCDETSPSQTVFMSQLCSLWEQAADEFARIGTEVVKLRLGVVLGQGGGVLAAMMKPIQYLKVGKVGSGRQPLVWVHIDDVVAVVLWLLQQQRWHSDVYNVVAPQITSQGDFVNSACQVLHSSAPLRLPASIMRLMMGEQSDLVLNGQKVAPKNLLEHGYVFQYPELNAALQDLLHSRKPVCSKRGVVSGS
ncbi:TIGR01777 family oxidoreductase [Vitreoscilla massiliensis]|uniref:TIGR01777 family oxidoreductase n=1 Tax=Vitreoscilla massiliensis TaxID=1689272 RepID=A0ABY4E3C1_9NEIS|nr:TIGR01777 family oxidoreductase [Vitreoscilla massiliensis]UOO89310.1 TIGR01777 family oxidoreductase [Vitreoscilla massiliensis]